MTRKQASFATRRAGGQDLVHARGRRRQLRPEKRRLPRVLHADAGGEGARAARALDLDPLGRLHDATRTAAATSSTAELALDKDGNFLALRLDWIADMGAYLSATGSASHTRNATTCMTGVYAIPALYGHFRLAFTNTVPVAAYRGAGRPDIAYVIERLVNQAASGSQDRPGGAAADEPHPERPIPYKTANGATYESADLAGCLDKALKSADWAGLRKARARQSKKKGQLRGIGIATVIEPTGAGQFPKDQVLIECTPERITAFTLSHSQGQSHETTFAMVVARCARAAAGQGADPARASGEEPDRQPYRRLALHRRGGQRVQARGVEAVEQGEIRSRARAWRGALAGRVFARRVPARRTRRRK